MIKLKIPLNHKGRLHEPGTVLPLPLELEAKLVGAGSAEYFTAGENSKPVEEQIADEKAEPVEEQTEAKPKNKGGKNESQKSD